MHIKEKSICYDSEVSKGKSFLVLCVHVPDFKVSRHYLSLSSHFQQKAVQIKVGVNALLTNKTAKIKLFFSVKFSVALVI